MFNSSVLDVAIGLIFVYLLLGLMCTTVNEWIAQIFQTRSATLREGIRRLLHAPPDGNFAFRPTDINVAALLRRFDTPGDKLALAMGPLDAGLQASVAEFKAALAANRDAPAPAPLAAALTAKLNAILDKPELDKMIDDSKVSLETKAEIAKQPSGSELQRVNHVFLAEAYPDEITSLYDAFYNHPLIRGLARPGQHPSYVPSKTFALALIDILGKGRALASTADQTLDQIKATIVSLPDGNVKKSLQALLTDGMTSVDKVGEKLEAWFNGSMDRVSGWYKNRVQIWTVLVASLITILVNADTVQIAQKLMINPALRDKIVQDAKGANGSGDHTLTEQQKADLASFTGWSNEFRIFHHLSACADTNLRGADSEDGCRAESEADVKASKNPKFVATWNSDAFPGTDLLSGLLFEWLWLVVPVHLTGWILTAIAASLGAPFWFDTLNKFMNVRAAGTSPTEKGSDKSKV